MIEDVHYLRKCNDTVYFFEFDPELIREKDEEDPLSDAKNERYYLELYYNMTGIPYTPEVFEDEEEEELEEEEEIEEPEEEYSGALDSLSDKTNN